MPVNAILVGEAPSQGLIPFAPQSRASRTLADLLGMDESKMRSTFAFYNLLPPQPRNGKGRAFDAVAARDSASRLLETMGPHVDVFVLAGRRVARAFGIRGEYFKRVVIGGRLFYVIPHPSGINRWWNEQENREEAREWFRWLAWYVTR